MRNTVTSCVLLISAVLATACAFPGTSGNNPGNLPAAPVPLRPDGGVRVDTDNEEVAKLWASAETARRSGRGAMSLELLYEALELDPENSLLWSRAAELQLDGLDAELAESYAERSNSFAGDNSRLKQRNWMIIERSRSQRGDLLGQRSAHKQIQFFESQ